MNFLFLRWNLNKRKAPTVLFPKTSSASIIIVAISSLSLLNCSKEVTWKKIYTGPIVVGDQTTQDLSKEKLAFRVECDPTPTRIRIKFFKPEEMIKHEVYGYMLNSEIHYHKKYYLKLHKGGNAGLRKISADSCKFYAEVWKRKRN